jgi:hypothetical protein
VLHRANLVERVPRLVRQQLAQHSGHGIEGEDTGRDLRLAGRRNDVRALAGVEHEGIAVSTHDCSEQRIYESHARFTKEIDLLIFRPKS